MGSVSQFNWRDLGLQVGACFNSLPPNVSFLLGPLDIYYTPKEREKVKRCKKAKEEESKNEYEEEQPEDVASRIQQQGQESQHIDGTLRAAKSQVKALVNASKITEGQMEKKDMVGGSNTLEMLCRFSRNRRREKRIRKKQITLPPRRLAQRQMWKRVEMMTITIIKKHTFLATKRCLVCRPK